MDVQEQAAIAAVLTGSTTTLKKLQAWRHKLASLKSALMQDLLAGKRRVTALLEPESKLEKIYASG